MHVYLSFIPSPYLIKYTNHNHSSNKRLCLYFIAPKPHSRPHHPYAEGIKLLRDQREIISYYYIPEFHVTTVTSAVQSRAEESFAEKPLVVSVLLFQRQQWKSFRGWIPQKVGTIIALQFTSAVYYR